MTRQQRGPNLLDPAPAADEPNLWVARQSAILVPLKRAAKDEAMDAVSEFLARGAAGGADKAAATVSSDDVYPFRAIAASDGVDSYFTKQDPADSLKPMALDFAAGRSVLGNHDYQTFSYGSTISGKVVDANIDAPEYEAAFYPEVLKGHPEAATSKWLQTDGYVIRGLELNGNKSDSIIKGMDFGGIRRISISFTVGRYTCAVCGQDMLTGWFGDPEPNGYYSDEKDACMHFPGVDYGSEGFGVAVMHNNRALEESLVYMNASPSAMLMRKAAALAERGVLTPAQRSQVEARFGLRLPAFTRRLVPVLIPEGLKSPSPASGAKEVASMAKFGDKVRWTDADSKQREGRVTVVEPDGRLTVTTVDDEGEIQTVTIAAESGDPPTQIEVIVDASEILASDEESESGAGDMGQMVPGKTDAEADGSRATEPAPATATDMQAHLTGEKPAGHATAVGDSATMTDMQAQHDNLHSADTTTAPHSHSAVADREVEGEAEVVVEQPEAEPTAESITADFVAAAERLVAFVAKAADAFSTADGAAIYGAERSIEGSLVDLSAERSVGGDVARQHEMRSKVIGDVLGGELTVTRVRTLMAEAADGRQAKADLIRDTVAVRVGVQGEKTPKNYASTLQGQSMEDIKADRDSWKEMKKERFTAGRTVVPRDITSKGTVDKRTPARPVADKAEAPAEVVEQSNLLEARTTEPR